jgi:uncharacterized protein
VISGKEAAADEKFRDYYTYSEALRSIPSHRALALFRGRKESVLKLALKLSEEKDLTEPAVGQNSAERMIAARFGVADQGRPADAWLGETVRWAWRAKIAWQLESDLFATLRGSAEEEAIRVFARNLHDLLLAAPAGPRAADRTDPGLRTGVKVAVVDRTGKLLNTGAIFHAPAQRLGWIDPDAHELAGKHSAGSSAST